MIYVSFCSTIASQSAPAFSRDLFTDLLFIIIKNIGQNIRHSDESTSIKDRIPILLGTDNINDGVQGILIAQIDAGIKIIAQGQYAPGAEGFPMRVLLAFFWLFFYPPR